jgi:hypothetical protein
MAIATVIVMGPGIMGHKRLGLTLGILLLWEPTAKFNPPAILSMNPEFDQQALTTIKQWVFEPAIEDGRQVAVYITVDMEFRLH